MFSVIQKGLWHPRSQSYRWEVSCRFYLFVLFIFSISPIIYTSALSGMGTCRTSWTKAVCTSSSSVSIRSLGLWRRSGSAAGRGSAWALCSSYANTSTPTTAVRRAHQHWFTRSYRLLSSGVTCSIFVSFFSADSFETMLKSLLGYQSGMGGGASETVIRKKMYESAINNTLKNNFPLVLKVCITDEKTYLLLQTYHWHLFFLSWWRSWWKSGSHSRRINTPRCVPTC